MKERKRTVYVIQAVDVATKKNTIDERLIIESFSQIKSDIMEKAKDKIILTNLHCLEIPLPSFLTRTSKYNYGALGGEAYDKLYSKEQKRKDLEQILNAIDKDHSKEVPLIIIGTDELVDLLDPKEIQAVFLYEVGASLKERDKGITFRMGFVFTEEKRFLTEKALMIRRSEFQNVVISMAASNNFKLGADCLLNAPIAEKIHKRQWLTLGEEGINPNHIVSAKYESAKKEVCLSLTNNTSRHLQVSNREEFYALLNQLAEY